LKRGWCASARSKASARDGCVHTTVGTSSSSTSEIFFNLRASDSSPFPGTASDGGALLYLPELRRSLASGEGERERARQHPPHAAVLRLGRSSSLSPPDDDADV
jgi:hypothetical protein